MAEPLVRRIKTNAELLRLMRETDKAMLLIFTAGWCGACKIASKWFEEVAEMFEPVADFYLLIQEEVPEAFVTRNVQGLPTFVLVKHLKEVGRVTGNAKERVVALLSPLMRVTGDGVAEVVTDSVAGGKYINVIEFIDRKASHCLGVLDEKEWLNILDSSIESKIESDTDAQMILTFSFQNPVQLHSFSVAGPLENGPKGLSIFSNEPRQLDFTYCEENVPLQKFSLSKESLENASMHKFKIGKYRNVSTVTFFISSNQSGDANSRTVVTKIKIYGCLVHNVGMSLENFKRVAGEPNTPHE